MKRQLLASIACLTLVGTILISIRSAVAQTATLNLSIEDVMTPREMTDTGISALSMTQRTALNTWLNRYTGAVIKLSGGAKSASEPNQPASKPVPSVSPGCKIYHGGGGKESITENADGKILILLDGSMWQVMDIDTIDSSLWLAVDDVIIIRAERPIGCYTYTIINTDESAEKVQAQYLGQQ